METVLSTPGIMDEYGQPRFGEFFVAKANDCQPQPCSTVIVEIAGGALQEAYSSDPSIQLMLVDWDAEGCTPSCENQIVAVTCNDGRCRQAYVTDYPTTPIEQIHTDTAHVLKHADLGPDEASEVHRRWVLYDLDTGNLLGTRVFDDYEEAVEYAERANDILVLPLVIRGIEMSGPGEDGDG
jgi:hypothetical protein